MVAELVLVRVHEGSFCVDVAPGPLCCCSRSGFRRLERAVAEQEVCATARRVADSGRPKPSLVHFASCGRGSTGNALFLAGQNDVFFCPGVDLATMRAGEFWGLDLGCGPELFFDGLTGRG